MPQFFEKF